MDHNSISSHNKGNLKNVKDETLFKDYEVANRDLDEFQRVTRGAEHVVIEGKQSWTTGRPWWQEQQPQLEGLIETEKWPQDLRAEVGLWIPYWTKGTVLDLGHASFGHGRYTNKHHAYQHASKYGRNFYYGHLHDTQAYTVERDGDDLKYEAALLGCVCTYQQYWLRGRPTKWQQAISVFRFQPNGNFNRYTCNIFNHSFISPEGKLYKG